MGRIQIKINNGKGKGEPVANESAADTRRWRKDASHCNHSYADRPSHVKSVGLEHSPIRTRTSPVYDRAEGRPLQATPKQYSVESAKALTTLYKLESQYNNLAGRVDDIEKATDTADLEEVFKSKNTLAQIIGDIDKLQFMGLDAVQTCDLHSGKAEARSQRKNLNKKIEELLQRAKELHNQYEELSHTQLSQRETTSEEFSVDTETSHESAENNSADFATFDMEDEVTDTKDNEADNAPESEEMEVTGQSTVEEEEEENLDSLREQHILELKKKDEIIAKLRTELQAKEQHISDLLLMLENRSD